MKCDCSIVLQKPHNLVFNTTDIHHTQKKFRSVVVVIVVVCVVVVLVFVVVVVVVVFVVVVVVIVVDAIWSRK